MREEELRAVSWGVHANICGSGFESGVMVYVGELKVEGSLISETNVAVEWNFFFFL